MNMISKHLKPTILVVDDDLDILETVSRLLSLSGTDVITASTYDEADSILENITIHLAVIDFNLEGERTGIHLIEKMKENKPQIPIVMITGYADDIVKIGALEAGVNVFVEKPIDFNMFIKTIKNTLSLVSIYENLEDAENIIEALVRAVELKDTYTEGHSKRIANYSVELYDLLSIGDLEERNDLYVGCLLHDIGKLGIADNILKSERKLTQEERDVIETHTLKGYEVCKDLTRLNSSLKIIRNHHEKLDGTGYPDKMSGEDIPIAVRIATISDIYDALTSKRSYRSENTSREAFKIMQQEVDENKIDDYIFYKFKRMIIEKI